MKLFDLHHDLPLYIARTGDKDILKKYISLGIDNFISAIFPFRSYMNYYDTEDPFKFSIRTLILMKELYSQYGYKLNELNGRGFIVVLEGAYGIDSIYELKALYELGLRVLGLSWNKDNTICAYHSTKKDYGLTQFGKEIVSLALDLNMIIDLAHASDNTFNEVLNTFGRNIIVSHTGLRHLNNSKRNITFQMIERIMDVNGVVGIAFGKLFLGSLDFEGVVEVLSHLLKDYPDTVCIGSDAFGVPESELTTGLESLEDLQKLYDRISKKLGKSMADKLFFENARDFFKGAFE